MWAVTLLLDGEIVTYDLFSLTKVVNIKLSSQMDILAACFCILMQSLPYPTQVVLRVKWLKSCTHCKLESFVLFCRVMNKDNIATHLNFWLDGISQNKLLAILKLASVILSGFVFLHLGPVHGTSWDELYI